MIEISQTRVRRRDRRWRWLALAVFVAVFLFVFLAQGSRKEESEVQAASLANFDPGYIISDYQMGNYNSMNEAEIQAWLTSKNSCPNTNYDYYLQLSANTNYTWHWENGHFVCLSEELFGDGEVIGSGETAAHIIWQTAQDYHINPQVILVLLQKETGLITDPIPNNGDYRKATGYGCPDTAPCSSQYYGFKNQVRKAAVLFRTVLDGGWTNYPLGDNYIQYNPSASCGGSVVNIRSLATSALYRYTPYQPNEGALAAGYGTAYCGAYGNRNFYLYFEDWFGGIVDENIVWEDMSEPRVLTVVKSTAVVDASENDIVDEWLNIQDNYYFTKKTIFYWGGEQQVCLQRRVDEGTDKCVLMSRLLDVDWGAIGFEDSDSVQRYEVTQWTCLIRKEDQIVDCGAGAYSVGDIIESNGEISIDHQDYLLLDNIEKLVLKKRTRKKFDFEKFGPILMRLTENSYKLELASGARGQELTVYSTPFIKIAERIYIDGQLYYRTFVDASNDNEYVISSDVLTENIFSDFIFPRNLVFKVDTNSVHLGDGSRCRDYAAGRIVRHAKKILYGGVLYFQSVEDVGTQCVVSAELLGETVYNFNNDVTEDLFVDFIFPRNLIMKEDSYLVNLSTGETCDTKLPADDIRRYITKATVNGMNFYRSEDETNSGSFCAVPSEKLDEV